MSTTPDITLRSAAEGDVDRASTLLCAQLEEHGIRSRKEHIASRIRGVLEDPSRGFVLVALVGPSIEGVAYVSFAAPLEHEGEVAWLEELFVTPEHRNRGLGKRLLDVVIERAEARGCVAVDLEVTADHSRAARLYEREGFRSMRRDHMTKPLSKWDW